MRKLREKMSRERTVGRDGDGARAVRGEDKDCGRALSVTGFLVDHRQPPALGGKTERHRVVERASANNLDRSTGSFAVEARPLGDGG